MVRAKKESVKLHHVCQLILLRLAEDTVLVRELEDSELVFYEAGVLISLIDSVIELIDCDWLPWLLGKLTLLGTAYRHQLKERDEIFYILDDFPGLLIDIQGSFMVFIQHELLGVGLFLRCSVVSSW